jgi:hypothetical protein
MHAHAAAGTHARADERAQCELHISPPCTLTMQELAPHHGSGRVGTSDLGKPRPSEHGKGSREDCGWGRDAGKAVGVNRVAVENRPTVLRRPVHSSLEQSDSDAAAPVLAANHEAGDPPRVKVFLKDAGKCPVLGYPRQRRPRHRSRPADHVAMKVGQQTDRRICLVDLTLQRVPVCGLVVPAKALTPARIGVLLPRAEDPSELGPSLSSGRHHTHRGHRFRSLLCTSMSVRRSAATDQDARPRRRQAPRLRCPR